MKSDASSADLPLPSQLETRLRAHLEKHEGKSELLFVNKRGRPYSANKLREKQLFQPLAIAYFFSDRSGKSGPDVLLKLKKTSNPS